jgi:hypothetical protein
MADVNADPLADVTFGDAPAQQAADPLAGVSFGDAPPAQHDTPLSGVTFDANPAPVSTPAAEPDYASMGLGTALGKGILSTPAATGTLAKNLVGGARDAAAGMLTTGELPGAGLVKAGDAWVDKNVPGAHWLNEKLGYAAPATDADYAAATQPLSDLAQNYKDRYGSMAGFKKTLATDLPGMALDVASVADPALRIGRGAGLVGKAADVAAPVSEAQIGERLRDVAKASADARSAAYDAAYSTPGNFHPLAGIPIWQEAADAVKSDRNFPKTMGELNRSPNLVNVKNAILNLQDHINNFDPRSLDMASMENIRRGLRTFADGANGNEKHLIGKLIEGFDNGVAKAASHPGLFSGDGAAATKAMADARDAHVSHMSAFGNKAPLAVKNAVKVFGDDLSAAGPDEFQRAGVQLRGGLTNEGGGAQLHSHLTGVGVPEEMLNPFLQERMLTGSNAQVAKNLGAPQAQKAFGDDLARARKLAAQHAAPAAQTRPVINALAETALTGFGATHGPVGAVMGHYAKKGLEGLLPGVRAPAPMSLYEKFATPKSTMTQTAARGVPYAPLAASINATEREQHARGGKVGGHQHLVNRLMRGVDAAKKAEQTRTSVLLQQPDEMVAKALNTAHAAI